MFLTSKYLLQVRCRSRRRNEYKRCILLSNYGGGVTDSSKVKTILVNDQAFMKNGRGFSSGCPALPIAFGTLSLVQRRAVGRANARRRVHGAEAFKQGGQRSAAHVASVVACTLRPLGRRMPGKRPPGLCLQMGP